MDNHSESTGTSTVRRHAALVYKTSRERQKLLADYFKTGLDKKELCIYATPSSTEEIVEDFQSAGIDINPHIEHGSFRVYSMVNTYMPDGYFSIAHMLSNLIHFMEDAEKSGFSGLRAAGEMNWLYNHPEATEDVTRYESAINHFTSLFPTSILCLFPTRKMMPFPPESVVNQHPYIIDNSEEQSNSSYDPYDNSTAPNKVTDSDTHKKSARKKEKPENKN